MDRQRDGDGAERERSEELSALARLLRGGAEPAAEDATPTALPPPAQEHAGARPEERFELGASLGEGPHGQVFRARDREQQGRTLCLKRLGPELSARAGLEERIDELGRRLCTLPSAGFVRLLGVARDPAGRIVIASDLVAGVGLGELLEQRGVLAPRHALEIARQILVLLEAAHERNLAHGHLCAANVRLASRVAWSAKNPFGVGVELTDHGLAALLGEPASSERDLFELGRLLSELVTGTRIAPDGRDWPVARAAVPAGELRRMLDRALAPELARRFPSARAWRHALERTAAWRGESARTRVLRFAAAGAAGAALLFLLLFLRARRAVHAAGSAEELAGTVARLEQEVRAAHEHDEHGVACAALDRYLEGLEEGDLARARAVLEGARAEPALAHLGFATGFLEQGLEAARLLASAQSEPDPLARARLLPAARRALAQGDRARETFLLQASPWFTLDLAPRPARGADCLRWYESLQRELEQRSTVLEARLEERWQALTAAPDPPDPRAVLTLAAWFADARLAGYAERLAARGASRDEALAEGVRLLARDAPFPGPDGARRVYHERRADGAEGWVLCTVLASEAGTRWQIEERSFTADGRLEAQSTLTLERNGTRFEQSSTPARTWFDLDQIDAAARLVPFHTSRASEGPASLGLAPGELRAFRAELEGTPALVLTNELGKLWLSARFGLLRAPSAAGAERELVFASR